MNAIAISSRLLFFTTVLFLNVTVKTTAAMTRITPKAAENNAATAQGSLGSEFRDKLQERNQAVILFSGFTKSLLVQGLAHRNIFIWPETPVAV